MRPHRLLVLLPLLLLGALLVPLTSTPAQAVAAHRILITGDSITQGSSGDYTWRYRLWNKLASTAPGAVAFVGTRTDLFDNVNNQQGSQHYAASFGAKAHSALWGTSFQAQLPNIAGQVTSTGANVLVVMLGSNDLAYLTTPADTAANLRTYIERARAARPGIDVVVGEVVNRYDPWSGDYLMTPQVNEYATRLQNVASTMNTSSERVVIAPTRSGWDAKNHTWDGTHPDPTGEALIAQRISQGLAQLGIGTSSPDVSGAKSWGVEGPAPTLSSGSEEIRLGWNRVPSGATGMYIEQRLMNTGEPWKRLQYPVAGDGWTADLLAAGGTYQYRVVPTKGFITGLSGPAAQATAGGPYPGAIGSVTAAAGGDSFYGGVQATASWSASSYATGYLLSSRLMHNGTVSWDDLPYPVTERSWVFQPLRGGYRYQFRVRGVRGFHQGAWDSSPTTRMRGLPGGRVYVALGDSYSSGLGSSGDSFGDGCARMEKAWAFQLQSSFQESTKLLACAGDTIAGVREQMSSMDSYFDARRGKPQLITLTVGGNDVGFSDTLAECVLRDCADDESQIWSAIDDTGPKLRQLYDDIQARQPYADFLVGGYPWVVEPNGPSGNAMCERINGGERQMIARLSTHLNDTIASAARSAGVWTVGNAVRSKFIGHNACASSDAEWIHAGNLDIGGEYGFIDKKSFHPKDGGQLGYALVFSDTLINLAG